MEMNEEEIDMVLGDILIICGAIGGVIVLVLIPVCAAILRRRGKRLTDEIYRDYDS